MAVPIITPTNGRKIQIFITFSFFKYKFIELRDKSYEYSTKKFIVIGILTFILYLYAFKIYLSKS